MTEDFETNPARPEMAEQTLFHEAQIRLDLLGLTWEDIRKFKKVLDLGAGICHLERAARLSGLTNVYSAGLEKPKEANSDFIQFDAFQNWSFKKGEFDLIVSRKGPLFLCQTPEQAQGLLLRMIQAEPKEIRINPARFGYIKEQMFKEKEFKDYKDINLIISDQRTSKQQQDWKIFNLEANRRTQEDLRNFGYNFSVVASGSSGASGIEADDFSYILFLAKQ